MTKWIVRGIAIILIFVFAFTGFVYVSNYEDAGEILAVDTLRCLYEYNKISEVYQRNSQLKRNCSEQVYEQVSPDNSGHYEGILARTKNYPTKVRVVLTRPSMVVFALENPNVYPEDLWCFEYQVQGVKLTHVREYKFVSMRQDGKGGFF